MTIELATPTPLTATSKPLTRPEAEALTVEIRANANRLWMLVAIAHDRKAWRALGYDSWKHYVATELQISEQRSFQLVDTGKVMLAIAEASGVDPADLDPVPARTVAKVKNALPRLQRAIRAAVDQAADSPDYVAIGDVIAEAVAGLRDQLVDTRTVTVNHTATAVACPACDGTGYLGTGRKAQNLAERLTRWLARQR